MSAFVGRSLEGSEQLMSAVDQLNRKFGRGSVFVASAGGAKAAAQKSAWRSPRYLSRVDELPTARA